MRVDVLILGLLAGACNKGVPTTSDAPQGEAASARGGEVHEPMYPVEHGEQHGEHGEHHGERHGEHGEHHGEHGERHGEHGEHHGEHDDAALDGHHRHHGGHHRFDDPERWAREFDSDERIAWQKPDAVIAGLALPPDAAVVDLGAGTGTFAVRFARALPKGTVYATDIEPSMVEYLGARAEKEGLKNLRPVLGAAEDPKIPAPVDLAFLCDVFHHIEDVPGFFGAVKEAIRPGGRLVIVDFKKDAPDDAPGPPKAMRVAAEDVVARLTALGFESVSVDASTLEYQYVVVLRRP